MTKTTITMQREALAKLTTDWDKDASHPPNYVRQNGMGKEIARVDVWCGGYQNPHNPIMIGWRAQRDNRHMNGVVLVPNACECECECARYHCCHKDQSAVEATIAKAKCLADKALKELSKS
jgi:hypothetical protein